jgi:sulfate/thiosulfate transport system substrate-binding protein
MKRTYFLLSLITLLLIVLCTKKKQTNEVVLTLGAYTVPKEAYQKEIIPAFQQYWQKKTGQPVSFQESYIGSGAQSRAIEGGFEADIAALSLQKDVDRLKEAGLIHHDWKAGLYDGMVTYSVVVIAVRKGNPKNIQDWDDLAKPGIQVICPSPKTSGGAMWDINAIYGAGLKTSELQNGTADPHYARQLLKNIQRNIKVMDKSARASVVTFESGVGDALLTYENEALLRQMQGEEMDFVIPSATILIENPIAVVDAFVDKHKNREAAEAFINFVKTPASQRSFAKYGFRPVDPEIAAEVAEKFPKPKLLFDVKYLGGWEQIHKDIYGEQGAWTKVMEELGNEK